MSAATIARPALRTAVRRVSVLIYSLSIPIAALIGVMAAFGHPTAEEAPLARWGLAAGSMCLAILLSWRLELNLRAEATQSPGRFGPAFRSLCGMVGGVMVFAAIVYVPSTWWVVLTSWPDAGLGQQGRPATLAVSGLLGLTVGGVGVLLMRPWLKTRRRTSGGTSPMMADEIDTPHD